MHNSVQVEENVVVGGASNVTASMFNSFLATPLAAAALATTLRWLHDTRKTGGDPFVEAFDAHARVPVRVELRIHPQLLCRSKKDDREGEGEAVGAPPPPQDPHPGNATPLLLRLPPALQPSPTLYSQRRTGVRALAWQPLAVQRSRLPALPHASAQQVIALRY